MNVEFCGIPIDVCSHRREMSPEEIERFRAASQTYWAEVQRRFREGGGGQIQWFWEGERPSEKVNWRQEGF